MNIQDVVHSLGRLVDGTRLFSSLTSGLFVKQAAVFLGLDRRQRSA